MTPIGIVIPTLNRIENCRKLIEQWSKTTVGLSTLYFCIDNTDPALDEYRRMEHDCAIHSSFVGRNVRFVVGEPARLCAWTNRMAVALTGEHRLIGSIGDDHRPMSIEWEVHLLDALDEMGGTGFLYGNDTVHGERLPTACFVSADIIRVLGWMAPPALIHLFIDNVWRDLGEASGCVKYLPGVVIEHFHPIKGAAEWDQTYQEGNSSEVWTADAAAYSTWKRDEMAAAVAKIKALRA